MLGFRKYYLLLFITIWSNSFSQMSKMGYEFNTYYEKDFIVNKILTNDENFITRRELKIKSITHKTIIKDVSLDSIYLKYPNDFKNTILSISKYHFSNNAYYQYDSTGILNSYKWYPTTKYLTKTDSIAIDEKVKTNDSFSNQLYLSSFKRNKFVATYNYSNRSDFENKKSVYSITHERNSKRWLSEEPSLKKTPEIYDYSKNKTKITTHYYDSIDHVVIPYINEMLFNSNNKLIKSVFYQFDLLNVAPAIYEIKYDSLNNVIDCTRKYGLDGNKELIYKFENTYINCILSKVVCTSKGYSNNQIFLLNKFGLITSIENEGYTEHFEYQYY